MSDITPSAVLLALPSTQITKFADSFRRRFDREWFERVPPHISIVGPFTPCSNTDECASRLVASALKCGAVKCRLKSPEAFISPGLVLHLEVEVPDKLLLFQQEAQELLGVENKLDFEPHITLGQFASEDALSAALQEVACEFDDTLAIPFEVKTLHMYVANEATSVFQSAVTIELVENSAENKNAEI